MFKQHCFVLYGVSHLYCFFLLFPLSRKIIQGAQGSFLRRGMLFGDGHESVCTSAAGQAGPGSGVWLELVFPWSSISACLEQGTFCAKLTVCSTVLSPIKVCHELVNWSFKQLMIHKKCDDGEYVMLTP